LRAVEDQSAPIPEETTSKLEGLFRGGVDEVRQGGILLSYTDKEMDEETAWARRV